jgi:hypothetical protein
MGGTDVTEITRRRVATESREQIAYMASGETSCARSRKPGE